MATLATTAIDVVGALFVELLQPFEEGLVAQPVEEDSSLQVALGARSWIGSSVADPEQRPRVEMRVMIRCFI